MRKSTHNTSLILILPALILPLTVRAITFEPPDRELTPDEKKVGSMYRGCIGYHCLEEEPYLEVGIAVADRPCEEGHGTHAGRIDGKGYACLTVGTNAREGVLIHLSATSAVEVCPESLTGGMRWMIGSQEKCGSLTGERLVMGTDDQAEGAFGRLRLGTEAETGDVTFMTLVAY